MNRVDHQLAAFGRHVQYNDGLYWAFAAGVVAIGVALALVTDLWGLAGLVMACFSLFVIFCRKRYEKYLDDGQ
jgi:Flp pilus assembly protein TadB